jgi:5-formyltetrahydrofolate cyclo-ligase
MATTSSMKENKDALRRRARAGRAGLPTAGTADGDRLADLVLGLLPRAPDAVLAAYLARPGEPPTGPLLERCRARGLRVLLPVLLPDRDLDWAPDEGHYRPGPGPALLEPDGNRLGGWAPAVAALILVPALAVDRSGVRLGQGGGSYDRALARVPASVPVVALLHPGELVEALPRAPHDCPVHAVVTVDGVTWIREPAAAVAPGPRRPGRPAG